MATKQALANIYIDALRETEGILATLDTDGDILFKYPGLGTFFISLDLNNDPEFLRIVFPQFADAKILTQGNNDRLLDLVNKVNKNNKVVKLFCHEGSNNSFNVSASVECIVAGPNEIPDPKLISNIIRRLLSTIRAGVESLVRFSKEADAGA